MKRAIWIVVAVTATAMFFASFGANSSVLAQEAEATPQPTRIPIPTVQPGCINVIVLDCGQGAHDAAVNAQATADARANPPTATPVPTQRPVAAAASAAQQQQDPRAGCEGFLNFTCFLNDTLLAFGKEVVRGLKQILDDAQASSGDFLSQTPSYVWETGFFHDTRILFWVGTTAGIVPAVALYLAGFKLLPKTVGSTILFEYVGGKERRGVWEIIAHFIIAVLIPFSSFALFIWLVGEFNQINRELNVPLSEVLTPNVDDLDSFVVLLLIAVPYLGALIIIFIAEAVRLFLMFGIGLVSIPASCLILNKDWVPTFKQVFTWSFLIMAYQTVILLILKFDLEAARAMGSTNTVTILHTVFMVITAFIIWKSRGWMSNIAKKAGTGAKALFS